MKSLDYHFDCVRRIALAEIEGAAGCREIVKRLLPPFETLTEAQLEVWLERLSHDLTKKCWTARNLDGFPELNRSHLLFVAETGDAPEFVTIGFPMLDVPYSFESLECLDRQSTLMLPQFLQVICSEPVAPGIYFECVDLFRCSLSDVGLKLPLLKNIENTFASRLLVDALAILAMVKSWRNVVPRPDAVVYFCTSIGSYAFGRPVSAQE